MRKKIFLNKIIFIPIIAFLSINHFSECLDRPNSGEKTRSIFTEKDKIEAVLAGCANYCEKLSRAALDFTCRENIKEEFYQGSSAALTSARPRETIETIPLSAKVFEYEYDYQLIRKNGEISETRILLKENGEIKNIKNAPLKTKRFYSKRPIFGPVGILGLEQQNLYQFKIKKHEQIDGRDLVVIEAKPRKKSKENPNFGEFWIDTEDYSIIQFTVEQDSLAGFKRPRNPRIKPQYVVTHYYNIQKNGLRFPSKTVFQENYTYRGNISQRPMKVSETTFTFTDYKFFIVDVDVEIK